jgi:Tol biopolymer transport system component
VLPSLLAVPGLLLLAGCLEGRAQAPPPTEGGPAAALAYERDRDGNTDVYWIDVSRGAEHRLTRHPARDILPRWTRDGRAVVFSSERDGHWQLYRVPVEPEGAPPERLRPNEHREWQADPTPDGLGLAFLSDLAGSQALFVAPWRGGEPRLLVQHGGRAQLGNPHWSRDGGRIVYSSNRGVGGHRIYLTRLSDGEERRLSPLTSGGCEPRFRPDGEAVAYVRRRHATRHRSWIVEHDLATGEERELVSWAARNYDPVYSSDGGEIAFASTLADDTYAIYRMRLGDGRATRVTMGPGQARHPDYRPARIP